MTTSLPIVEVETTRMATGGEAVARLDDGRVVFVAGALEGERVRVRITEQKKRFARGVMTDVLSGSVERIVPDCEHAASGLCGGCDWRHVTEAAQQLYKRRIVVEQLERLGGLTDPCVVLVDSPRGRRTTVRCLVVDGRAGYRSRRSHTGFGALRCPAAHPLIEELIVDGRFPGATEVMLRVGATTGERIAVVSGETDAVRLPPDVAVVARGRPGSAAIHEQVAGRNWQISPESFFQASPEGAAALVGAVGRGLHGTAGSVVDLYCGVGLLGGATVPERLEAAVEQSPSSVADARVNLGGVEVIAMRVERWTARPFDAVIADPARRGLGVAGADVVARTGAGSVVLVSCDPASLGRDTALLRDRGYEFAGSELIDMFPDTSRIEVVTRFER